MLTQLLLPTKPFFARHSTTLLAKLYVTSFLLVAKFWQMNDVFASTFFCLICYCACAETATVVLLASSPKLSSPCSRFRPEPEFLLRNFGNRTGFQIFCQFSAVHAQKWPELHFRRNVNHKFETQWPWLFPMRILVALTSRFTRVLRKKTEL